MNEERDKYLTEALSECWHEVERKAIADDYFGYVCKHCGELNPVYTHDFSTWEGFGKLWNWSKTQEWWADFMSRDVEAVDFYESMIDPDHYADAVYELLKESEEYNKLAAKKCEVWK